MTPVQTALLRETWEQVIPIGDAAATIFYDRLFEIDETAKPLFAGVDMAEQRRKLLKTLNGVIEGLNDLEALIPAIQDLGRRHAAVGVTDAQYDSVGAALLWTLEKGLGDRWSTEAQVAWARAYGLIADTMREAAKEASDPGAKANRLAN